MPINRRERKYKWDADVGATNPLKTNDPPIGETGQARRGENKRT